MFFCFKKNIRQVTLPVYIYIYIYVQYVCTCLIIIKIGVFEKQYCIYGSNIEYTFT